MGQQVGGEHWVCAEVQDAWFCILWGYGIGFDGLCGTVQELSGFPSEARGPVEVLHPAMYTCTAMLLLCLFTTIITYIVHHG